MIKRKRFEDDGGDQDMPTLAELTCEEPTNMEEYSYEDDGIEFLDDITGKQLHNEKAKKARQNELDELDGLNV